MFGKPSFEKYTRQDPDAQKRSPDENLCRWLERDLFERGPEFARDITLREWIEFMHNKKEINESEYNFLDDEISALESGEKSAVAESLEKSLKELKKGNQD